jgi:hypothetical protein
LKRPAFTSGIFEDAHSLGFLANTRPKLRKR